MYDRLIFLLTTGEGVFIYNGQPASIFGLLKCINVVGNVLASDEKKRLPVEGPNKGGRYGVGLFYD